MWIAWTCAALVAWQDAGVTVKYLESGATAKVGGYRPIRAELSDKGPDVKKAPEGLAAPKYGALELGDARFGFILDEPEGQPARLFVDANRDGDYTNDPETTWKPRPQGKLTMHEGRAKVALGADRHGAVAMYRFDPADPGRTALKNTLLYYGDFGQEITLQLDGREFTTAVAGSLNANARLWIDRDGNGRQSFKRETITVGQPFNFTGTTYVLALTDGKLDLKKSAEERAMEPLPPDLRVGQKALPFKAQTTDGREIDFPKTYAGKLVMLDFWATWCGPCIAEIPNVKKAYEKHHEDGFEVLGISFDQADKGDVLAAFVKERGLPWPQIYEGKGWNTMLGEQYEVTAIPFVLLVDGDTGEILGTARELRGPGLSDFIEKALAKKKGT